MALREKHGRYEVTLILRIPSLRKFLACVCDDNFIPPPCAVIAPDEQDDLDHRRTLSALTESSPLRLVVNR